MKISSSAEEGREEMEACHVLLAARKLHGRDESKPTTWDGTELLLTCLMTEVNTTAHTANGAIPSCAVHFCDSSFVDPWYSARA